MKIPPLTTARSYFILPLINCKRTPLNPQGKCKYEFIGRGKFHHIICHLVHQIKFAPILRVKEVNRRASLSIPFIFLNFHNFSFVRILGRPRRKPCRRHGGARHRLPLASISKVLLSLRKHSVELRLVFEEKGKGEKQSFKDE